MQTRGTIGVAFVVASAPLLTACPGTETKGCGPLTATVGGQFTRPFQTEVNTKANINDSGTAIDWQVPPNSTNRVIDGTGARGPIASPTTGVDRSFSATGTRTDAGVTYALTVTGTIKGPAPPCTAVGRWILINSSTNQSIGSGPWSVP
jgi:hypothetical protein